MIEERPGGVTTRGNPLTLLGTPLQVGDTALAAVRELLG